MSIRKIVFWSHLVVGVATGLVVLVLAVTGVLLTYEPQMLRWAERGVSVPTDGQRLDADALADAALIETGGAARALVFENDPRAPVAATLGRRGQVLLDPYTGATLAPAEGLRDFFGAVTSLHRWLSLSGMNGAGKAATGVANLGFFFLALSGAYLWLPRIWRWARLKYLIFFRRSYPNAQVRDFHWHHIFAFWAFIPLVVVIFTGITMSYDKAQGVVMTLVGVGAEEAAEEAVSQPLAGEAVSLEALLAAAMAFDPGWARVTLDLPESAGAGVLTATVDTGAGRQPNREDVLTLSRSDASVIGVETFADRPKAVRTFLFLRFGHTGEYFGLIGQTLAGLASLATVFMVYTGLALAWRRLVAPVLRRRRSQRQA